jgi:hypothetical protein
MWRGERNIYKRERERERERERDRTDAGSITRGEEKRRGELMVA